jgi:hypothetical protein
MGRWRMDGGICFVGPPGGRPCVDGERPSWSRCLRRRSTLVGDGDDAYFYELSMCVEMIQVRMGDYR